MSTSALPSHSPPASPEAVSIPASSARVAESQPTAASPSVDPPAAVPPEGEEPPRQATDCLPRDPEDVELSGVVERATFPGPPNYESIAHGDGKETCWLLRLDRPACLAASLNLSGDVADSEHIGIRRVQLVFHEDEAYQKYRDLVGRRVHAVGHLFGAETGHHHTEVLLDLKELARAPRSLRANSAQ